MHRGYLLLETLVSGVILTTAILGLLTQLADARIAGITTARERIAARLVTAELEDARARAPAIVPGVVRRDTVKVGGGSYQVETSASDVTADDATGPAGSRLRTNFIAVRSVASFEVRGRALRAEATTRLYR